jgi:selenide, water dikinase
MSASAASMKPLTHYSPGGGCACKMPQAALSDMITALWTSGTLPATDGRLLVGLDTADDAAVYDVGNGRCLLLTCDFLTPVVDDPFNWGRIAAANALSDVYAMGGRPLLALNLLGWPADLNEGVLTEVLRGGARAIADAGALLAGGHSIVDPAPKYGLAVLGEVDPDVILLKGGGRPGDALVLTKPLGLGVVGTAIKRGQASATVVDGAIATMTRLNADAASAAREFGLRGGTDVTGYGLIGHLHEMGLAGGLAARIDVARVPLLPGVAALVESGCGPDGSKRTLTDALDRGWFKPGEVNATGQLLLADAQTSGGLLLAVPALRAGAIVDHLRRNGDQAAAVVGDLLVGEPGAVVLQGKDIQ